MTAPVKEAAQESALKLRAVDSDDIQVVSAILQDAIVPVCDMAYQADEKNFILVAQRLRPSQIDGMTAEGAKLERICCALNVRGVDGVQTQNIDMSNHDQMLDLLAVIADHDSATLIFAGDAKVRLKLSSWTMFVEDFGEAWPSACTPCHDSNTNGNANGNGQVAQ